MEMSADRRADDPGVGGAASAPPAEPRDRLSHANQRMPPQPWPELRPWAWGVPAPDHVAGPSFHTRRGWKGGRRGGLKSTGFSQGSLSSGPRGL